jgi:hypothetical protein
MRVVAQDIAVLARARLALIGVADHVLRARELARHERPLEAGGEPGAAAPAQRGLLQLRDEILGLYLFTQYFSERSIALALLVIGETPVLAIDALHQDRVGTVIQHTRVIHYLRLSKSWSSFSCDM